MNIVQAQVREMFDRNPQKHIEAIGRICYKSEDMITEDSHRGFVKRMHNSRHWAMLEHFRFILQVPTFVYEPIGEIGSPYIVRTDDGRKMISGSARGFMDALEFVEWDMHHGNYYGFNNSHIIAIMSVIKHIVWHYGCDELFGGTYSPVEQYTMRCVDDFSELTELENMKHGWHSVLFTCDRGVSHELVRHRPASFAQESTRYCNYTKGKFGGSIAVIDPIFFDKGEERKNVDGADWAVNKYDVWQNCMENLEKAYTLLIELGATPQEARTILPNSLKTDIVLTATNEEWDHIIDLRYVGSTGKPHPQMVEVMTILVSNYDWAADLSQR